MLAVVSDAPALPTDIEPPDQRSEVFAADGSLQARLSGVENRGMARAAWANLRAGRVVQGGSTLTQQYVKNALLSPGAHGRPQGHGAALRHRAGAAADQGAGAPACPQPPIEHVTVPDLVGQTLDEAEDDVEVADFNVEATEVSDWRDGGAARGAAGAVGQRRHR